MARRNWRVHFFEWDAPWYAEHRDLTDIEGATLSLYPDWNSVLPAARRQVEDADVAMVTSYCPDAIVATELVLSSGAGVRCFYDLDAGVTLNRLSKGEPVEYIGERGLRDFDLVLTYTGGRAMEELRSRLGARNVAPLYGSVDPEVHYRVLPQEHYTADLSYLGTFAEDRQAALEALFIEPARRLPNRRFVMGGAMYPRDFPWTRNVFFVRHLPPEEHPAFYSSSRLTLNVTRRAMAAMGYCPPARIFEAAACGTPVLTDRWEGIEYFFKPGSEILVADRTEDAMAAIDLGGDDLAKLGARARERALDQHTAAHRVSEFENILGSIDSAASRAESVEA